VVPTNSALTQLMAGGFPESIHLLGERTDISRLMASLDVLTCASISEGFPNVIGEAMACGVPCVVTDIGDMATIVDGTGVVVPVGNAGAMAQAWESLICAGPERRRALGQAAREHIRERYNLDGIVRQYEDLYAWLIDQGRRAFDPSASPRKID
jgi:glycosyltransferase involved in cell wall biosynthesis